ncbi:MAG: 30S ribosomal protein S4 [Candidatus Zixiibacteriota bacterium]|nr:MAG: 30S ribosomal protein S4 [candidate division Zixibacteria bacterium]
MARYSGANCKLCRREGMKLFLKGNRCYADKCGFDRRGYPPGQHGNAIRRRRTSGYGLQLREKQKVRRIYGVLERQFRNYFERAERCKGITGENLLQELECRLDNIVYRLGFAPSRKSARQLVRHDHFQVNGRQADIPSYALRPGDIVSVREKSRNLDVIHDALKDAGRGSELPWLRLDKAKLEGELLERPKREDIPVLVQEQLIVELYSK